MFQSEEKHILLTVVYVTRLNKFVETPKNVSFLSVCQRLYVTPNVA